MADTYRVKCPRCLGKPGFTIPRFNQDRAEGQCFCCHGVGTIERRKPQKRKTMEDAMAELNARIAAEWPKG